MPTTRTRRLAVTAALALGVALAPATAAGAASGLATPIVPPGPPVGPGGVTTKLPLLSIELDDATEHDSAVPGRLVLSSPLAEELTVSVGVSHGGLAADDVDCFEAWGAPGGCTWYFDVAIPAGATEESFLFDVASDDGDVGAEVLGAQIFSAQPRNRVRVGPGVEAVLYDGAGLEIGLVDDDPEAPEGDAGTDGTLDLEVATNQAVPHPISFRVRTGIVGGYNGGLPGVDYEAVDVVVELPAGETSLTVEVPLIGDDLDEEPHELFFGYVQDPSHGEIAFDDGSSVARILDDDGPVVAWSRPGDYQSSSRSARSAAFTA